MKWVVSLIKSLIQNCRNNLSLVISNITGWHEVKTAGSVLPVSVIIRGYQSRVYCCSLKERKVVFFCVHLAEMKEGSSGKTVLFKSPQSVE